MPVIRITKTSVDKLVYNGKQTEYFDTKLTGFGVRVNATSKTYFAQGKVTMGDGERIKFNESIGRVAVMLFDDAEEEAKRILGDAERGILPTQRRKEKHLEAVKDSKRDITLSDVHDEYIEARTLKDSTKKEYRECLVNIAEWMDIPIRNITSTMILKKHGEIGKRSRARADGVMRVLRALCQYVIDTYDELDILQRNPVRKLSSTKTWYRLPRKKTYIRFEQLPAWFSAVLDLGDLHRMYFLMLLFSGARFTEIASVRVSDFYFQSGSYQFRETKNGDPLEIPISSYILPRLEAYIYKNGLAGDDYVFPSTGNKKSTTGHLMRVEGQCDKILKASGVSFTPNDLRRTFLSACESLRIPKLLQKRLVGHAIPTDVTDGYIQIPFEDLEAAMEEVTEYILKMAKQE